MSYILDALRKSDQQRQRGAAPTLHDAQQVVVAPRRPMSSYYILLAVVLLGVGIMIGWLFQRQPAPTPAEATLPQSALAPEAISQHPVPQATPVSANAPTSLSQQTAPALSPPPPEIPDKIAKPGAAAPVAPNFVNTANDALTPRVMRLNELPPAIRQEIPVMTVQLHAYSNNPSERLVSINSIRLREGQSLMLGLTLEQITPDGMVFNYKGYRFQRDIR